MKTRIKKILFYLFINILVLSFWKVLTQTDNYAWNPKGKDLLILDIALTSIFIYKSLFWLIITNLFFISLRQLIRKNRKLALTLSIITIVFYFFIGNWVDKKCAFHYYSVFINQSVTEEYLDRPILEAGYQIGHILTKNISDKEMERRLYAIGGLEKIKYKPATPTLTKILHDKSDNDGIRAVAFQALSTFDTDETKKIITEFRIQPNDTLHKKVIENVDYWLTHK